MESPRKQKYNKIKKCSFINCKIIHTLWTVVIVIAKQKLWLFKQHLQDYQILKPLIVH